MVAASNDVEAGALDDHTLDKRVHGDEENVRTRLAAAVKTRELERVSQVVREA